VAHVNEAEATVSVSEQAAHWWAVLRDEQVSAAEEREFAEWVKRSPERIEAYLRIARVQAAVSRPDMRWPSTPAEVLIRDALASQEDPVEFPRRPVPRQRDRRPRFAQRVVVALAASLFVAVGAAWLVSRPEVFQTSVGEMRTVLLDDGSRITLNTDSKIEVRLQSKRRSIRLVRGEALFEVAHDAKRPFDVETEHALLRAVGTQFDVDRRVDRTILTVVEGRVAMFTGSQPEPGEHPDPPVLGAADRVVIGARGAGTVEHDVNLSAAMAWLRHQLVFQRRPLGEVAEEFNRYNRSRIDIRSAALRAEVITGTFQVDEPGALVAFIAGTPGVRVSSDGRGGYIITADEPESPGR